MNRGFAAALRCAFPRTLPIFFGYLFLGVGFGVLLAKSGYAFWWASFTSATVYSGSMQYVAVDLLNSPFSVINAVIMTIMVNIRHVFYGLSLIEKYSDLGKYKFYCIFGLTDETYSLVCSTIVPETVDKRKFYFCTTLLDHLYWIFGCTLGAIAGQYINFDSKGIEFVMTALFVAIFIEQWENAKCHIPAMTGVAVAAVCLIVCRLLTQNGAQIFLIPSMCLILAVLSLGRKGIERRLQR